MTNTKKYPLFQTSHRDESPAYQTTTHGKTAPLSEVPQRRKIKPFRQTNTPPFKPARREKDKRKKTLFKMPCTYKHKKAPFSDVPQVQKIKSAFQIIPHKANPKKQSLDFQTNPHKGKHLENKGWILNRLTQRKYKKQHHFSKLQPRIKNKAAFPDAPELGHPIKVSRADHRDKNKEIPAFQTVNREQKIRLGVQTVL